jgi:trimeric autotransporter adhesin
MPNLVGIGLSQVPTNSMLGGLAYQDPEHASIKDLDLKNLSQINSEIADTAVDVFVYDTSKDSDGGAWRKRTTHTSWYNETLGTATRGTRKEFPAVAVIVAEVSKVTIYDGDDPDLPMWMVFDRTTSGTNAANTNFLAVANINIANIFMLNGILCVAFANGGWGVSEIGFVSDSQKWWWTGGIYKQPTNTIAERHVEGTYYAFDTTSSVQLGNANIQDLAMAVQPNAKVDGATGLPIPTIALGTGAQANIIKHDGSVVELTGFSPTDTINIDESHVVGSTSSSGGNDFIFRTRIPSSDEAFTTGISVGTKNYYMNSSAGTTPLLRDINHTHVEYDSKNKTTYRGGNAGFDIIVPGEVITNSISKVAVAYATTSFNTGYMIGDIKGAYLSDTDDTNLSTTDLGLITNGDFSNGATGWSSDQILTVSGGGVASVQRNAGSTGQCYQTITTEVGRTYTVGVLVNSLSNGFQVYKDTSSAEMSQGAVNTTGTHYWSFTATSTSTRLDFSAVQSGTASASFDNITIFDGVADRSVSKTGLAVYGTINKSAVATGAELVAYHGFTSSNYLRHRGTINYGNAATITMGGWSKIPGSSVDSNYRYLCSCRSGAIQIGLAIHIDNNSASSGKPYFYDITNSSLQSTGPRVDDNQWHHIIGVLDGGSKKIYIDGELIESGNVTGINLSAVDITNVGHYVPSNNDTPNYSHGGYLALIKFSASAPTAEQVKKMYEDEKHLFQENAKCTLYGSSDTVTALAYDEVTEQLHVGTSAGRSDFQGLRRINNTTTAVTTAISAHDGFIIEQ